MHRIFDRNFTTRQLRSPIEERRDGETDGTSWHAGIGLWVVRRNIGAMNGWVTAENNPDRGLTIRFTLPAIN